MYILFPRNEIITYIAFISSIIGIYLILKYREKIVSPPNIIQGYIFTRIKILIVLFGHLFITYYIMKRKLNFSMFSIVISKCLLLSYVVFLDLKKYIII
jgi:hypothetical protein